MTARRARYLAGGWREPNRYGGYPIGAYIVRRGGTGGWELVDQSGRLAGRAATLDLAAALAVELAAESTA